MCLFPRTSLRSSHWVHGRPSSAGQAIALCLLFPAEHELLNILCNILSFVLKVASVLHDSLLCLGLCAFVLSSIQIKHVSLRITSNMYPPPPLFMLNFWISVCFARFPGRLLNECLVCSLSSEIEFSNTWTFVVL